MSILLIIIGLGVIAYGVYHLKNKQNVETIEQKTSEPEKKVSKEDELIEKLYLTNFKLRTAHGASKEVINQTEEVIDKLRKLIPQLNKENEFSELTVTVNRIPQRYLPTIIDNYLALEDKKSIEGKVLENLKTLSKELDKIQNAIDEGFKDDYQKMSILIEKLFEENEVGV